MSDGIFVGGGGLEYGEAQQLALKYANRHGLIAGATGTGKTVTVQILAQAFSDAGVPVFVSDVKGDLSGLGAAGAETHKLHAPFMERAAKIGLDLTYGAAPVTFWDLWGQQGHPVRATVAEMGPLLLSQMLDLTDVQEGVLNIAFPDRRTSRGCLCWIWKTCGRCWSGLVTTGPRFPCAMAISLRRVWGRSNGLS